MSRLFHVKSLHLTGACFSINVLLISDNAVNDKQTFISYYVGLTSLTL